MLLQVLLAVAVAAAAGAAGADERLPRASSGVNEVKQWATNRVNRAVGDFGGTRRASPASWQDRVVYQIVVDRFNNGNESNDALNLPAWQPADPRDVRYDDVPRARHGGDLRGVVDRLEYLADLGVNALWLTPVFANDAEYHAYCTTDPTRIDPAFGTLDTLRELVAKAHALDILVVLDVVINHLCDARTTYAGGTPPPRDVHVQCANELSAAYWAGDVGGGGVRSAHQTNLSFADSFFPPLAAQRFYSRCGANSGDDTAGVDAVAVWGDFVASMLDYNTADRAFQEIFAELMAYWVAAADVDGFRLDAAKHVAEDFLAYVSVAVRERAAAMGKRNFYVVGEVAAPADWIGRRVGQMMHDPAAPAERHDPTVPAALTARIVELQSRYQRNAHAPYPGLNAVYDFAASGTGRAVLHGQRGSAALAAYYESDAARTIAAQAQYGESWTCLAIHDWPRFLMDTPANWRKAAAGVAQLVTLPGAPIIYYGIEQGLSGTCDAAAAARLGHACSAGSHEAYRQDMFVGGPWLLSKAVPVKGTEPRVGPRAFAKSPPWQNDPFLARSHALYNQTRALLRFRRSCTVLNRMHGAPEHAVHFRMVSNGGGAPYAYARVDDTNEVLTIINPGLYPVNVKRLVVDASSRAAQAFVDVVRGDRYALRTDDTATTFVELGDSFVVYPDDYFVLTRADRVTRDTANGGALVCAGVAAYKPSLV